MRVFQILSTPLVPFFSQLRIELDPRKVNTDKRLPAFFTVFFELC